MQGPRGREREGEKYGSLTHLVCGSVDCILCCCGQHNGLAIDAIGVVGRQHTVGLKLGDESPLARKLFVPRLF